MAKVLTAIVAAIVAVISFLIARRSDLRSKKAENIKNLLGEKEQVAFGALKLLRNGLPKKEKDRSLVISALMQACLFERSDRARALLYRTIEKNKVKYGPYFEKGLRDLDDNIKSMAKYNFTAQELDLHRAEKRIAALTKVVTYSHLNSLAGNTDVISYPIDGDSASVGDTPPKTNQ